MTDKMRFKVGSYKFVTIIECDVHPETQILSNPSAIFDIDIQLAHTELDKLKIHIGIIHQIMDASDIRTAYLKTPRTFADLQNMFHSMHFVRLQENRIDDLRD